jgi:hypothetical protein
MRRRERETGRCSTTDERVRYIAAVERVLFLNLEDVEFITYPGLNRDNRLSVDLTYF